MAIPNYLAPIKHLKAPLDNLTLISHGCYKTQELIAAEQDLQRQALPVKITTCLYMGSGMMALGVVIGALFNRCIGALICALSVFPFIGASHLNRQKQFSEEGLRQHQEDLALLFQPIAIYLNDFIRKKDVAVYKEVKSIRETAYTKEHWLERFRNIGEKYDEQNPEYQRVAKLVQSINDKQPDHIR